MKLSYIHISGLQSVSLFFEIRYSA